MRGICEAVLAGVWPLAGTAVKRTTNDADSKILVRHRLGIAVNLLSSGFHFVRRNAPQGRQAAQ
jgi:hypothetical protein